MKDGALGAELLDGRLDRDVDVIEALPADRALDGRPPTRRFACAQNAALDSLVEQSGDPRHTGIEGCLVDFLDDDRAALEGGQLSDACAHDASPDHADALHLPR